SAVARRLPSIDLAAVTMIPTPAAMARAITASRSASNAGASRGSCASTPMFDLHPAGPPPGPCPGTERARGRERGEAVDGVLRFGRVSFDGTPRPNPSHRWRRDPPAGGRDRPRRRNDRDLWPL